MRKVKESGCVERGVCSVRRESERQAACYEAVEGCVEVASMRHQYAPRQCDVSSR